MFKRKKPWQNRGIGKESIDDNKALENEYYNQHLDITSQYQSNREVKSTISGFLILCTFIVCYTGLLFLIGLLFV